MPQLVLWKLIILRTKALTELGQRRLVGRKSSSSEQLISGNDA
jgi:hypothetical protein